MSASMGQGQPIGLSNFLTLKQDNFSREEVCGEFKKRVILSHVYWEY